MKKQTLISYLVNQLNYDQDQAKRFIGSGKVLVNDQVVIVGSILIKKQDKIKVKPVKTWVSRGANKILKALEIYDYNLKEKIILDIGSSTGGFSQVCLTKGAKHVYALDVGTNQLAYKIRIDPRVTVMEKTNVKHMKAQMFDQQIDLAVCDVSFISLKYVFQALSKLANPHLKVMALIKPSFEAKRTEVKTKGIVPKKLHECIIKRIKQYAMTYGFSLIKINQSPILGRKSKTIEYLSWWRKNDESQRF